MPQPVNASTCKVTEEADVRALRMGGDPYNESSPTGDLIIDDVEFTIGAEAANAINVGIQLKAGGQDLAYAGHVMAYLSDDSGGIGISGTAPATSVAIGTDGAIIKELTTKLAWLLQSEVDGDIDLTITETGADTWYLVVVVNGRQFVSGAIIFAA